MSVIEVLRLVNCAGCLFTLLVLLTLPGGPSSKAMCRMTLSLALFLGTAAYSSIDLLHDPDVLRPVFVFTAMLTAMLGTLQIRRERIANRKGTA